MRENPLSPPLRADEGGGCYEDGGEGSQVAGLNSPSTSQTTKLALGSKIQESERIYSQNVPLGIEELFETHKYLRRNEALLICLSARKLSDCYFTRHLR